MECIESVANILAILFILGYIAITIESLIHLDKAAVALFLGVVLWTLIFVVGCKDTSIANTQLIEHLGSISQIIFFLLGALVIVETINAHNGFNIVSQFLQVESKTTFLWLIGFITFFLSSILDNLTTTIVMVSLISQILPKNEERYLIGGAIVIAANAGGAWTAIGDVTTTMLWIGGQVSADKIMVSLFLPSLVCLLVSLTVISFYLKGPLILQKQPDSLEKNDPLSKKILLLGIGALVFVPIFKVLTGLPPYMGIFLGVSVMWFVTDFIHKNDESKSHLRLPQLFKRIDMASILFFIGILLSVDALESSGILKKLASWLDIHVGSTELIATAIGLASAVVDNVPLVAASMGMYSLESYPPNSTLWELIAYCAGTGGSILIIGSAAGVVYMGMERVSFFWYLKRISLAALLGYFAGIAVYQGQVFLGMV